MSWIGLRDKTRGYFNEAGLGQATAAPVDLNALLPKGSLLMSLAIPAERIGRPTVLLRQRSNAPWISAMSIELTKAGDIRFRHMSGDRTCEATIRLGLQTHQKEVILTYTWDAPKREGVLSVELGDTGQTHFVSLTAPMPLSLRDAIKLTRHPGGCALIPSCAFLAIADHIMPHGPLPSLGAATLIPTPTGVKPADRLRSGDLVQTSPGRIAQVRWAGTVELPARGRFRPVRAKAPFYGATRDLTGACHQRIELRGSEVEYLFARECVSVRIGDLPEHAIRGAGNASLTERYVQILLDTATPIEVGGLQIETLKPGRFAPAALRKHSILKDLPAEMMPTQKEAAVSRLYGLETLTLCNLMTG